MLPHFTGIAVAFSSALTAKYTLMQFGVFAFLMTFMQHIIRPSCLRASMSALILFFPRCMTFSFPALLSTCGLPRIAFCQTRFDITGISLVIVVIVVVVIIAPM